MSKNKVNLKYGGKNKMKKILKLFLVAVMCLSVVACGQSSKDDDIEVKDAVELLNNVWSTYSEDELFPAMGGDYNAMAENAPGKFDLSDPNIVENVLHFPADSLEFVDDAASIMHMMNANTFTCGAFHVADGKMDQVSAATKDNIMNTQWICGFPQLLVMVDVNGYLVAAFGNEELITTFKTKLLEVYKNADILFEESLA